MNEITLGQAAAVLAFIVAVIGGTKTVTKSIKEWLNATLKDQFAAFEKKQDEILKRLDSVDTENCKNYLVVFLAEVGRGEPKDETELQRFWEEYEHYQKLGGNSYIKNKVAELKEKKLL